MASSTSRFVAMNIYGTKNGIVPYNVSLLPVVVGSILEKATAKERTSISDFIKKFVEWIKSKLPNYAPTLEQLESKWLEMVKDTEVEAKENNTTEKRFDIVNLDNGNSFVKAKRRIITATTLKEMRTQISRFFNKSLEKGPITINTIEGDILTITKDTANKARDNHTVENGITRKLSDSEFRVKLNAETHIDELAEISVSQKDKSGNKKITPDIKHHTFAKDGFSYRTAYFEDFDGKYYKITLSIGEGNIATIYNVGKIKSDNIPNGNIVSAIGSKADMLSDNNIIPNNSETVKENFDEGEKQLSIPTDTEYLKLAENPEKNKAELEKMVEEAARKEGFTEKLYHGTDAEFTKFDLTEHGGKHNIPLFAEELFNSSGKKRVEISDRASFMNILLATDSYTVGTGIMPSLLNNGRIVSIPFESEDQYIIGYILRKDMTPSPLAGRFIEMLQEKLKL